MIATILLLVMFVAFFSAIYCFMQDWIYWGGVLMAVTLGSMVFMAFSFSSATTKIQTSCTERGGVPFMDNSSRIICLNKSVVIDLKPTI